MKLSYYTKWRRVFWILFVLNVGFALLQIGAAYEHIVKHAYWLMAVSLALATFNGAVAWLQAKNLYSLEQTQRRAVIDILSTKSQGE